MGKISRKSKIVDKNKFQEKVSMHMMLMGYNADYRLTLAQELNSRIWKKKARLSRKRMRRLQFLLYASDSAALLSFTVTLGRLIWRENLKAKRRKFDKKLSEKIKERSDKKRKRRGKPGKLRAIRRRLDMEKKWRKRKGGNVFSGFQMRPVLGSRLRMVVRRKVRRQHGRVNSGSLMYRLAMAMRYLSLRNVCITNEWEFWAVCFVQKVCGFWGSVAFGKDLSHDLRELAKEFGLYVVSYEHLERLESCFGCSSSARFLGCRVA